MAEGFAGSDKMKWAYFVLPHIGGTYTVFKSVRAGLALHDVDVRWLGVGPSAKALAEDPRWKSEFEHGAVAGGDTSNEKAQAKDLLSCIERDNYDGIFVNAACERVHSNIVRYMAANIPRIMTVHTITVGTYAGARAIRDYVHSTICVSPRIKDDLINKHGFPKERTHVIPNGIDIEPFVNRRPVTDSYGPLRLLSLGRVVDSDKGVFWLPQIMDQLSAYSLYLTVGGDGADLNELKRRCAHLGSRVRFIGRIAPDQVPKVLAGHDVLLFPSRFEGLPLTLVEAMAAGCVPVATRIKGVTDFLINHGENGLLFDIGNVGMAAAHIAALAEKRELLYQFSVRACQNVAGQLDLSGMAQCYFKVLSDVLTARCEVRQPLPIEKWSYPAGLMPGLRTYLPNGAKKWLRLLRERITY